MANPSPTCEVKVNAAAYVTAVGGVNVTAGDTVTIRLSSQTGVDSWSCLCITTDDTKDAATINATVTIDSAAKTATFTAPSGTGWALRFRSLINGGLNSNGVADSTTATTLCIYALVGGRRVIAADETTEGNSTFGWIVWANDVIRSYASISVSPTSFVLIGSTNQFIFNNGGSAVGATGLTYNPTTMRADIRVNQASMASAAIAQATITTLNSTNGSISTATLTTAAIGTATITSSVIATATLVNAAIQTATLVNAGIGTAAINAVLTGAQLAAPVLQSPIFGATAVYTGTDVCTLGDPKFKSSSSQRNFRSTDISVGIFYAWNIRDEAVTTVSVTANAIASGGAGAANFGRRAMIRADNAVATMGAIDNMYSEIQTSNPFTGAANPATGAAQASGFLRLWIGLSGMTGFVRWVGTPTGDIMLAGTVTREDTSW